MQQIEQIKKLADQIAAKQAELVSIEREILRCTDVLEAGDTAKRKLDAIKEERAQLLAQAFRADIKPDTKTIDMQLASAGDAVRAAADRELAARGALDQYQREAVTVQKALDGFQRDQRGLAADQCLAEFQMAEEKFISAVGVIGAAFVAMHSAHEALTKVYPHAGADLRELLRNYGSMRIFVKAPESVRGWKEPEWLGGPGLEQLAHTGADKLLAGFCAAGLETV